MNIAQASSILASLMDATDIRYSESTRFAHLNQAIAYLGRKYETMYNEGVGQVELSAGDTAIENTAVTDMGGNTIIPEVVEAVYYATSYTEIGINTNNWTAATWKKLQVYTGYEALFDAVVKHPSESIIGCTQRGGILHVLPAQTSDILVKILFNGPHIELASGTNRWLTYAPYPVIYQAAQYGCVYMEDEARIPVYERLLAEAIETVNLADSMRGDASMSMQEE